MAAPPRKKRRKFGQNDQVFSFARQFTLAHIGAGADAAHDIVEPAWDGHRMLATRTGREMRLAAQDYRDWTKTLVAPYSLRATDGATGRRRSRGAR